MKILSKVPAESIEEIKPEALDGGSESDYLQRITSAIASVLRRRPKSYRSYGPYWWPVKRILIDQGAAAGDFGPSVDAEWAETMAHDSDADTMIAAWLYQQAAINRGLIDAQEHIIDVDQDGDAVSQYYVIEDPEMEMIAAFIS